MAGDAEVGVIDGGVSKECLQLVLQVCDLLWGVQVGNGVDALLVCAAHEVAGVCQGGVGPGDVDFRVVVQLAGGVVGAAHVYGGDVPADERLACKQGLDHGVPEALLDGGADERVRAGDQ